MTRHMRECACHIVELEAIVEKRFFSDAPVPRLQDFHR
jgi:hypothetical protein